ncbi:hypothetical protein, partial [Pseudomonas guariconensis]|uniref:hypothetical protein n=1 Tax=Pseudomonas guariconensis TaxID=1288410 RepID=UPI0034D59CD7
FWADNIADFFCRHFGVTGAGTVKKTHIHNVSFSILLWLLRLVYQNRFSHGTIRHNGSNE